MGMIGYVLAVSQAELDGLVADPASIHEFLDDFEGESIDLDKAWHGVHFVLNGEAWGGTPPLNFLVGGKEIGEEDVGYGPARGHTSADVKALATALSAISLDDFNARYDAQALESGDVYPGGWSIPEQDADNREYLGANYAGLRQLVLEAAERGDAMLHYLR